MITALVVLGPAEMRSLSRALHRVGLWVWWLGLGGAR